MIRFLLAAVVVLGGVSFVQADEHDLTGVKCVVATARPVNKAQSAEFMGGKVYFCCGNCKGKFASNSKPFEAAAKMQLLQTGQIEQVACPFTGGPLNEATAVSFNGASIKFCCNNCKGKFEAATPEKKLEMAFNNFDKAYKADE